MNPATPAIVQTLPYVAWVLLATLGVGAFVFAVVTRYLTDATTGYLRFTALTAGLLALLAMLVDPALVPAQDLVIRAAPAGLDRLRGAGLALLVVGGLVFGLFVGRRLAAAAAGLGIVGALGALVAAAFGWAPSDVDGVPLLVQLVVLSVASGGSLAAITLGHWYLVTPRISERPLLLQARLLLYVFILQALLFVVWTTLGGGPGQGPWDAFSGANLLLVILRGVVTIAFPIVLAWMAWRTAATRSMESATGLLYINLAAVMAGTIGAAALYVSAGLLV